MDLAPHWTRTLARSLSRSSLKKYNGFLASDSSSKFTVSLAQVKIIQVSVVLLPFPDLPVICLPHAVPTSTTNHWSKLQLKKVLCLGVAVGQVLWNDWWLGAWKHDVEDVEHFVPPLGSSWSIEQPSLQALTSSSPYSGSRRTDRTLSPCLHIKTTMVTWSPYASTTSSR